MGKPLSRCGFLWQLERKRKYYMSMPFHHVHRINSRVTSTAATIVTFSLCFLLYVNLWSHTRSSGKNSLVLNSESHLQKPLHPSQSLPHSHPGPDSDSLLRPLTLIQSMSSGKKSVEFVGIGQAQLVKPSNSQRQFKDSPSHSDNNNNNNNIESSVNSNKVPLENIIISIAEDDIDFDKNKQVIVQKLEKIFKRVDVNKDELLSVTEMSKWINEGIKSHFSTALATNFDSFFSIDKNPRNGRVEWSEYVDFYLKSIGYKGPNITAESIRKRTEEFKKLPKNLKVDIAALEAKWSETASNDPDFLTVDEFLAFTHAEASPTKLLAAVQDTFSTFDLDGDGTITKTEFDTTYAEAEGVDNVYREDLHLIDADNNGKISRVELMRYMDPKNTIHSDKDAHALIKQVDANGDKKLSMKELNDKLKYVTKSKLYDVVKNLHYSQMHS